MRIAQVIQSIDFGGGGTSTAFLNVVSAIHTATNNWPRAFAAALQGADDPAHEVIRRSPHQWSFASANGGAFRTGDLGRSIEQAALAREFDLLHIHGLWSPDLLAAADACRKAGIPYFWEPHGMLIREAINQKRWKKELFLALGLRRALRQAAGLIFVTAEERDHSVIPSGIGPDTCHVVPLPVVTPPMVIDESFRNEARAKFKIPLGVPCAVFMGRLHPVKRVEMAIEALSVIVQQPAFRDSHLLLIGGGEEGYVQTLRAAAAGLGLHDRVIFAGWVQGDDKWRALGAGNLLTLNSLHENFGFVAVEALCVGTFPVLTPNLAIASELAQAGVGSTSDAATAHALAQAWGAAFSGLARDWRPVLSAGRAYVDEHLSLDAVGRRLVQVYQRAGARAK